MASLVADYGSSSGSDSETDEEQDQTSVTKLKTKQKMPLPQISNSNFSQEQETDEDVITSESTPAMLDNPFRSAVHDNGGGSASGGMTAASVFSNPYREAEDAEQSVLEKHVKMTPNSVKQTVINGRQVCWNYRKGRCRFGHNCKFAHDSDLPNAATLPSTSPPAHGGHNSGSNIATNSGSHLPVGNAMPHGKNARSIGYEPTCPNGQEDSDDLLTKKKKRPGLGEGLVPSKKVMKSFYRQQQQQRPWLSSRQ